MTELTMVGTLPPNKGISDTCLEQVKHLSRSRKIRFIDFKQLYPDWLYPGGTKTPGAVAPEIPNTTILKLMTWYNPLSWILAGLRTSGPVVHFHWWTYYLFLPLMTVAAVSKLRGKRLICNVHNVLGHESNALDRFLTGWILSKMDLLICHSEENRKKLKTEFGLSDSKLSVVPIGTPDFLVGSASREESRKWLGVPAGKKAILCFGNIRKYKGLEVLLPAVAELRKSIPEIHLIIAGKPWVDFSPYHRMIQELGLTDCVRLDLDYIRTEDVKYYFSGSDLLILPYTHFDAQSGPGRIALGYELPMIASRTGGLPDLVLDQASCVFEPGNAKDLSSKMKLLLGNEELLKKLARDCRLKQKEFSWEGIALRTLELYQDLQKTAVH